MYALCQSAVAIAAFTEARQIAGIREVRTSADDGAPTMISMGTGKYVACVRSALQATANVSKTFWPSMAAGTKARKATRATRGERLRNLANLPEDHPLGDRSLRDHIEHLDERLDEWTETPRPTFFGAEFVWPQEADTMPAVNRQAIQEGSPIIYNWTTQSVDLFGERFCLDDLSNQVLDVQIHISGALRLM